MNGKAAAVGARMMSSVADQVLKQFGDTLADQVQAQQAQAAGQAAAAPAPPGPRQLNGLALLWAIARDWLRSLFTAKRA